MATANMSPRCEECPNLQIAEEWISDCQSLENFVNESDNYTLNRAATARCHGMINTSRDPNEMRLLCRIEKPSKPSISEDPSAFGKVVLKKSVHISEAEFVGIKKSGGGYYVSNEI